eukprot:2421035-Pleurochrysis_carterae.AAC.1
MATHYQKHPYIVSRQVRTAVESAHVFSIAAGPQRVSATVQQFVQQLNEGRQSDSSPCQEVNAAVE